MTPDVRRAIVTLLDDLHSGRRGIQVTRVADPMRSRVEYDVTATRVKRGEARMWLRLPDWYRPGYRSASWSWGRWTWL